MALGIDGCSVAASSNVTIAQITANIFKEKQIQYKYVIIS